jgi:ribosomal protein S27E
MEHKHEWFVTFKDGRAYLKCAVCGAMRIHPLEGGKEIKR